MERFMPKSSYQDIHKAFYVKNGKTLDAKITKMLSTMFSSIKLRVTSAGLNNPDAFKHITLMIDGHDSRALHNGGDKAALYSYKLKKSGYRTQLCIDINGMILFLSTSEECRSNTDMYMLKGMNLVDKINPVDCIALDGGYPQSVLQDIVEDTDEFSLSNFCIPIRKPRGGDLTAIEAEYNKRFGSFRSMVESTFGELGTTFKRLSNKDVVRIANPKLYNLQMKLCCLLYNIRRMGTACHVSAQHHHSMWMEEEFEYPMNDDNILLQPDPQHSLDDKNELTSAIADMQHQFLTTYLDDDDNVYVDIDNRI
jgi:hypothetical protein